MKIMKRKSHNLLILFLITVLILTGCGAKGYDSASGGTEAAQIVSDADSGFQNNYGETKEMSALDAEASIPEEGAGEDNSSSPEISGQDLSSRKLIKTVSLTMETRTFDTLKKQLEDSIASFGGYVEQSSYDAPGGQSYRYYYLCVRIPSEHLDDFVNKAGKLGTITNQSENVQDVTLERVEALDDGLHIYGTNFTPWSKAFVNGTRVSTSFISDRELKISMNNFEEGANSLVVNQMGSSETIFRSSNEISYLKPVMEQPEPSEELPVDDTTENTPSSIDKAVNGGQQDEPSQTDDSDAPDHPADLDEEENGDLNLTE